MRLTLFCTHSDQIAHLEAEVQFWRAQFVHERQRAEVAIDRLLATRQIGPVTLPPRPTTPIQSEVEALLSNPEFVDAGLSG